MTTSHPTHAIVPGKGRCQVLGYHRNGYFFLLTNRDERIYRHRDSLTFVPATRPTPAAQ